MKKIWLAIALAVCVMFTGCGKEQKIEELMSEARSLEKKDKYEEAIEVYEQVLELDEMREKVYLKMADCYEEMGDRKAAWRIVEEGYDITEEEKLEKKLKEFEASDRHILEGYVRAMIFAYSDCIPIMDADETYLKGVMNEWKRSDGKIYEAFFQLAGGEDGSEMGSRFYNPNATGRIISEGVGPSGESYVILEGTDLSVKIW